MQGVRIWVALSAAGRHIGGKIQTKEAPNIIGNAPKIVEVNKISHIGIGTINKNFQSTGAVVSPIFIPGVHGR
jgi:hypothetical protein